MTDSGRAGAHRGATDLDEKVVRTALPFLKLLADASKESAYLSRVDGGQVLYLAELKASSSQRERSWLGERVPLEGTAVGAALQGVLEGGTYALCHGNSVELGVAGVAAPVREQSGQISYALSVIMIVNQPGGLSLRQMGSQVAGAAVALETQLGDGSDG